jgi:inner membrane protease subunit 1
MNRFLSRVVLLYHAALPVARHPIRHARAAARQYAHDARCDFIVFNAKPWPDKGKTMGIFCLKLANYLAAVHLFFGHVVGYHPMDGPSMEPTLNDKGDYVIENILSYKFHDIARGDLVTLLSPIDPTRFICKRVIGIAGDVICVDPTGMKAPSTEHVIVPKGHVWIMGDNASLSRDSRDYGPVPVALIRGKLVARVFPWKKRKIFYNPTTFLD